MECGCIYIMYVVTCLIMQSPSENCCFSRASAKFSSSYGYSCIYQRKEGVGRKEEEREGGREGGKEGGREGGGERGREGGRES